MARSKWTLPSIYEAVLKQIWTLGPIYFTQVFLIGLISYSLIKSESLSDDEKKNISYSELAVSFVASFIILIVFLISLWFSIITLFFGRNKFLFNHIYSFIGCLFILLFNPFSLTLLRVSLQDKITEQQKNVLSGITIPITIYTAYLTTVLAIGVR